MHAMTTALRHGLQRRGCQSMCCGHRSQQAKKPDSASLDHLSWPHSITWHQGLGKLLVADRGGPGSPVHSRIVVMDSITGHIEQTLNCAGMDTPKGYPAPFSVRALKTKDEDLLFVAVADLIPQDGA